MRDGKIRFRLPAALWGPLLDAAQREGTNPVDWIIRTLASRLGVEMAKAEAKRDK